MRNASGIPDRLGLGEKEMVRSSGDDRRTAVLLEEIHSEVRKVAEGHDILARGINRLEIGFGELDRHFKLFEQALTKNNERLEQAVARLDAHERIHAS